MAQSQQWLSPVTTHPLSLSLHVQVMWEYLDDGGLWQACTEEDSFKIEAHFFEGSAQFHLGDYHYHLSHMTRSHPQTKNHQRVKRTLFVQERREGVCVCVCVCVCV